MSTLQNQPEFLKAYAQLEGVLEDEIKVYRALLELVRHERDVLVSAKLDDLNENNRSKEAMVLKIRGLERQREKHARDFAIILGLNPDSPRLLDMAQKVTSPFSDKLRSIHSTLDLLIKRIKDFNKSNEALVEASLKIVNGALGAIKDTIAPKATYKPSGDIKQNEVAGHFVSRDV